VQAIKIGVLGAGHLGKIHIKCILESEGFDLVGFYDSDPKVALDVVQKFGVRQFHSIDDLIEHSEIVDIVTPTLSHYQCAVKALRKSKHVFIEKPLTATLDEARKLIDLSREANVKVQVGHVERFNPAFLAAAPYLKNPMFIETHRLANYSPRASEVPVVLDLMIHDIDIVLHVVKSPVKRVSANGVSVVSGTSDIANARIEFNNGCVANLTASRISLKDMCKTRFFQADGYISVDFLKRKAKIARMEEATHTQDPYSFIIDLGNEKGKKKIIIETLEVESIDAIKTELEEFRESIINNIAPPVTIEDGYKSLELAYLIMDKMEMASIERK